MELLSHSHNNQSTEGCEYEYQDFLEEKFILVGVCGTVTAALSFAESLFLLAVLLFRTRLRQNPNLFYLIFIVFVDIFISVCYILIMTVQNLMDYLPSLQLYFMWIQYLRPTFTMCHISLALSAYLLVAWTFEKFSIAKTPDRRFTMPNRVLLILLALFAALLTKGTTMFEQEILFNPKCTTQARYTLRLSPLAKNPLYRGSMFWFRNFANVLLPFGALAIMNCLIVKQLRRNHQRFPNNEVPGGKNGASPLHKIASTVSILSSQKAKQEIKDATMTTIAIVTVYLLATVMDVVVAIWESVDNESLVGTYYKIYTFATDFTSLSKVLCGTLRLPIAILCNSAIREEIKEMLCKGRGEDPFQYGIVEILDKELRSDPFYDLPHML